MTPLPQVLGGPAQLVAWRLDRKKYASSWDSGEGARLEGGRWNSIGQAVVYASLDPATTILEKAVHAGFGILDTVPHVMSSLEVFETAALHVVQPEDVPNSNWLRPAYPSAGQQRFGDDLLAVHMFVLIPSAVSPESWNLFFDPARAAGKYRLRSQSALALDGRLNRPGK